MPAAHQRSTIWPLRQGFTLVELSRQIPIIDSTALVDRRASQCARNAEAGHGECEELTEVVYRSVSAERDIHG